MKRVFFIVLTIAFPAFLMAQNSAVNKLFNKYKGKDGITTVQISPELFQIVKAMEIKEIDEHDIPFDKIASVKILTIEDEEGWEGVNFYKEIQKELDVSDFAEVLTVDDGGETVRMWMKAENATVSEFLLIVGGDDNVLIYITGDFNMNDLEGLAESFDNDLDIDL
ncbi:MAG: DUF4252 domain-containing protein [Bacteroidota bacterium]